MEEEPLKQQQIDLKQQGGKKQSKINVPVRSQISKKIKGKMQNSQEQNQPFTQNEENKNLSNNQFEGETPGGPFQPDKSKIVFTEDPEFTFENACHVCQRVFDEQYNRHHCRWCGKSVCKEHGQQLRPKQKQGKTEPQRICQICNQMIVMEEITNKQLAENTEQLKKQLDQIRAQILSKEQEVNEQNEKIKQQESKLSTKESEKTQKEQALRSQLQEQQEMLDTTKKITSNLRIALEQSRKGVKITQEFIKRFQQDLEKSKKTVSVVNQELQEIKANKEKVIKEIERIKEQIESEEIDNSENQQISQHNSEEISVTKSRTQSIKINNKQVQDAQDAQDSRNVSDLIPSFVSVKDSVIGTPSKRDKQAKKQKMHASYSSGCSNKCLIM